MYQLIENRASVPDKYVDTLVNRGVVTQEEITKDTADYNAILNDESKLSDNVIPHTTHLEGHWKGLVQASEDKTTTWDTGMYTGHPPSQPRPQGLLLVQNGGRRNPWPRLLKYSKNRGVFCLVTHDEMAFSEVVSSVWRPCLFSAIGNRCSNETKSIHRVYATKF